ncbi:MAG: acetyltransferase [Scytolyngbya sp. HA4215-MV1]|nr:acetyltransferase [Scytolyngbya sp. HA4215-MV1]
MFLQDQQTGTLVKVLDIQSLLNPMEETIDGKIQAGEEEQEAEAFSKKNLIFPSGESLPRCWIDENYRTA